MPNKNNIQTLIENLRDSLSSIELDIQELSADIESLDQQNNLPIFECNIYEEIFQYVEKELQYLYDHKKQITLKDIKSIIDEIKYKKRKL